ncbi:MAG: hypothetical protein DLM69_10685 [Candidatus Chloroheliales bacterium]|nr:MAG: hypothetical protein DLM69_10685 [Chloroflexota bacterium]
MLDSDIYAGYLESAVQRWLPDQEVGKLRQVGGSRTHAIAGVRVDVDIESGMIEEADRCATEEVALKAVRELYNTKYLCLAQYRVWRNLVIERLDGSGYGEAGSRPQRRIGTHEFVPDLRLEHRWRSCWHGEEQAFSKTALPRDEALRLQEDGVAGVTA